MPASKKSKPSKGKAAGTSITPSTTIPSTSTTGPPNPRNANRSKPYTRPQNTRGKSLKKQQAPPTLPKQPKGKPSKTASKLSALNLSSIGSSSSPFTLPQSSSTPSTAAPNPNTLNRSQLASLKAKDEAILDTLDAELGNVMQALSERAGAKKKKGGAEGERKARGARKQSEFEKTEGDLDQALAMMGNL